MALVSTGLTWNQSMVQQLMSEGNFLSLFLKASPMGLMARMTWRLSLQRLTKRLNRASGEKSAFLLSA